MLHRRIEKALDEARIVLVPDDEDPNELKLVVLDESLMEISNNQGWSFV